MENKRVFGGRQPCFTFVDVATSLSGTFLFGVLLSSLILSSATCTPAQTPAVASAESASTLRQPAPQSGEQSAAQTNTPANATPKELPDKASEPSNSDGKSVGETTQNTTAPAVSTPPEPPPFPTGTKVLHVGSSTATALGRDLKRYLEDNGVKCVLEGTDSTYIPQWAGPTMGLKKLIKDHKPDLVIVSLGGNETAVPYPEARAEPIQRIVKIIGDRPCVWVGTPRWKAIRHTGLLDVIQRNIDPCKFVDSDLLAPDLQTIADGVHPTIPERKRWARRMLQWLQYNRNPNGARPWDFNDELVIPPPEPPQDNEPGQAKKNAGPTDSTTPSTSRK